ncbi:hypothetical protein OB920_17350 [Halobacteria archaeon HArc-gm2]|nr:hypothetical protein [Halobacteria archaeon HArc-gm2]
MVSLTCDADHRDGVTLVTVRLDGAGVAQRVRLANRLDGPVWPPRRHGVPAAGWTDDGFETVVPADGVVAVGYASPAPPVDAPVAVVDREIVEEGTDERVATAADALRDLGDPSPPRDAVPVPVDDAPEPAAEPEPIDPEHADDGTAETSARERAGGATRDPTPKTETAPEPSPDGEIPAAVTAWLDDVEERVATAERLAAAETVPEATAAMRAAGGLDDAEALVERLQQDQQSLESVASRADALAERTRAADVPLETLERLA